MSKSLQEKRLDVSDLEPPEPLERVLAALDELGDGEFLHMLHRREPFLLYPELERRGFRYLTFLDRDHECEVFIWRSGDTAAEKACRNCLEAPPQ
jgi:uncharacterized protein (DUF2249 family)